MRRCRPTGCWRKGRSERPAVWADGGVGASGGSIWSRMKERARRGRRCGLLGATGMAKKSSGRGQRDLRVKVKTARGRKLSSTRWLERQLNDPYVQRARREGMRGRAARDAVGVGPQMTVVAEQAIETVAAVTVTAGSHESEWCAFGPLEALV